MQWMEQATHPCWTPSGTATRRCRLPSELLAPTWLPSMLLTSCAWQLQRMTLPSWRSGPSTCAMRLSCLHFCTLLSHYTTQTCLQEGSNQAVVAAAHSQRGLHSDQDHTCSCVLMQFQQTFKSADLKVLLWLPQPCLSPNVLCLC